MRTVFSAFPTALVVSRPLLDLGHETPVLLSNQVYLLGDFEAAQIRNLPVIVRRLGKGYAISVLTDEHSIAWFECFDLDRVIEAFRNFGLSRSQIQFAGLPLEQEFGVAAAVGVTGGRDASF